MIKRLFIVGAGGFGRQLESYIDDENKIGTILPLTGYLDDNPKALQGKGTDYSVMGNINDFTFEKEDAVILAIADPDVRERLFNNLSTRVTIYTYISKRAIIGKNIKIGEGTVICPGVNIGCNTTIGKGNLINLNSILGHDSKLEDYCSIMPSVDIGGNSIIRKKSFLGTKATIAPNLIITSNVKIGCGAVVIKEIKEQGTYFGNPARRIL